VTLRPWVLVFGLLSGCQWLTPASTSCTDGTLNGAETDLDCGGASCPGCAVGGRCLVGTDCASGTCTLNHCIDRSCIDGVRNGAETDVDCGGPCAPCAAHQACAVAHDCVTGSCVSGVCASPSCDDGQRNQGESDVDCGGPCTPCVDGKACAHDVDCQGNSCVDAVCGAACTAPLLTCNQACVDGHVDRANCGACGHACAADQACLAGTCTLVCGGGTQACSGACVDTLTNPAHCGGCNQPCGVGEVCISGACVAPCGNGAVLCNGECTWTDRDALHCGGCNSPCPPNSACVGGACVACGAPLTSCGGGVYCVDAQNDPANCGGCNQPCPAPNNAYKACSGGTCVVGPCLFGFEDCDGLAANGCEADLGLAANCGTCGHDCGAGWCNAGQCCQDPPVGTYQATCTGCTACAGTLSCLCNDQAQNPTATSIPLAGCAQGFFNCNGVLTCGAC
jgi:hypothetical protein